MSDTSEKELIEPSPILGLDENEPCQKIDGYVREVKLHITKTSKYTPQYDFEEEYEEL